jgi:hypothetical protein
MAFAISRNTFRDTCSDIAGEVDYREMFKALTAVIMSMTIFWDVTLCNLVEREKRLASRSVRLTLLQKTRADGATFISLVLLL